MSKLVKTIGFLTTLGMGIISPNNSNGLTITEGAEIPNNWKQTHLNQSFNSDVIIGLNVAYQPITNQQVINMFYGIGQERNPENPWEYMDSQDQELDSLVNAGRNRKYNGQVLPKEIRARYRVTPIPS